MGACQTCSLVKVDLCKQVQPIHGKEDVAHFFRLLSSMLVFRARAFLAATSSAMALFLAASVPLCLVDDRMALACTGAEFYI